MSKVIKAKKLQDGDIFTCDGIYFYVSDEISLHEDCVSVLLENGQEIILNYKTKVLVISHFSKIQRLIKKINN